jgi:hypothetical protein
MTLKLSVMEKQDLYEYIGGTSLLSPETRKTDDNHDSSYVIRFYPNTSGQYLCVGTRTALVHDISPYSDTSHASRQQMGKLCGTKTDAGRGTCLDTTRREK